MLRVYGLGFKVISGGLSKLRSRLREFVKVGAALSLGL